MSQYVAAAYCKDNQELPKGSQKLVKCSSGNCPLVEKSGAVLLATFGYCAPQPPSTCFSFWWNLHLFSGSLIRLVAGKNILLTRLFVLLFLLSLFPIEGLHFPIPRDFWPLIRPTGCLSWPSPAPARCEISRSLGRPIRCRRKAYAPVASCTTVSIPLGRRWSRSCRKR